MKITTFVTAALLLCSPPLAKADTVRDWNAIATSVPAASPFHQARMLAITQLAVFEAVNTINPRYEPYLGTLVAAPGASVDAAVITAAHGVLRNYAPGSAMMLDAARASALAAISDGSAKSSGITVGEAAAAAMIAARLNDGSTVPETSTPASADAGVWQLTGTCAAGALLHWRNLTPFGIAKAADFYATPPPALTSTGYAKDFDEVKRVGRKTGADRPQDRTDVARFYAASSPGYVVNLAARQLAAQQGRSLSESARAFALINMAISDSFVASFGTKYEHNYWRPETAIRGADLDGNDKTVADDPLWEPLIPAPCFPGYTSNHASGSYGGAEMLRRLYGAGEHDITITNASFPTIVYHYTELKQICDDIDDARVYGGIHFRFDQVGGARIGREVASAVHKGNLRRLPGSE